jgi:hypothetical protein
VQAVQSARDITRHVGAKLLLFQAAPSVQQHQMILQKITNQTDQTEKFGTSNPFFSNTAHELAHA